MIKLDISNVWGDLSLPDLLATEQEVFNAHKLLADGKGPGNDFLGWLNLPTFEETDEMRRIRRAAERIRSDSDIFVVVGIGGSYLGPRAAIELVKGQNHNLRSGDPQVFFAEQSFHSRVAGAVRAAGGQGFLHQHHFQVRHDDRACHRDPRPALDA